MSECLIYQLKPGQSMVITLPRVAHSHTSNSIYRLAEWTAKNQLQFVSVARASKKITVTLKTWTVKSRCMHSRMQ